MMDLIIRGGTIVDGTLAEPREADVGISGGKIVEVGRIAGRGAEEIDARGKIVTPGFLDIHTHYDGQALWSEEMAPSSAHGVTTAVIGNCGVGFAPCRRGDEELLIAVMEGVEDIPGAVMAEGLNWDWETYPQYLDALARRRRDIDIGAYFPHMPLRVYVMGRRGADREPATEADLRQMYQLTREAFDAGALGLASSMLFSHRTRDGDYVPTFGCAEEELQTLARAIRDSGGGVWQGPLSGIAGRDVNEDLAVLDRIVRTTGDSVMFSLGQLPPDPDGWRRQMAEVARLNGLGSNIKAQVFPRMHAVLMSFDLSVHPFCLCPSYRAIADKPLAEKLPILRDPGFRAKLLAEEPIDIGLPFYAMGRRFAQVFPFGDPPDYEPAAETCLEALAKARGVDPLALAYDMLLEKDGSAMLLLQFANYVGNSADFIPDMLRDPNTIIGLADAGAHYGMICDGAYTSYLLSDWTRDRKGARIGLAEAVHMITEAPARAIGLGDRGRIATGRKADLNVIDYDRIAALPPHVAHDLPANGKRVTQGSRGYAATIVGGEIIRRDDAPTGARPGQLVRGRR
jgi:N-acyl-D-aspartate/D-glutamate deacylase